MTCEDSASRITWEVQLYEPFSRVWICKGYGRATAAAAPANIARAVLVGYLAGSPARSGETFRAVAYTDTSGPCIVTADQLAADGWTADPAVRQALPTHLREGLPSSG